MRLDRIHKVLSNKMKDGCSEDSLRKSLGNALSKITTEQLLTKNPKAHAVDDVRVSREQFQKILVSWEELGLVACKKSGNRSVYYTGEPAYAIYRSWFTSILFSSLSILMLLHTVSHISKTNGSLIEK